MMHSTALRHFSAPFEQRLAEALPRVGGGRGRGLLSITLALPEGLFSGLPSGLAEHQYWASPVDGMEFLGVGRAASIETQGEGRLRALDAAFAEYRRWWRASDEDGCGMLPVALAGFAFDHQDGGGVLPNARLTIPRLLVQRRAGQCAVTFSCDSCIDPELTLAGWLADWRRTAAALASEIDSAPQEIHRLDSLPADEPWLALAAQAVADIRAGRLAKLVLARRVRVQGQRDFEPAALLARLGERYPDCFRFSHAEAGGKTFLGATPERLVTLRRGQASSAALAGTAWDADSLERLNDAKNLQEHRLVVAAIVRALEPACRFLEIPAQPEVLPLRELRHLKSTIKGSVKPGTTLLDLAERLHPTPAVGGWPGNLARDWLARQGEQRPAWYSGATGWLDFDGDGDFAVALRCATLHGKRAELYAGAGIVAASEPHRELAEIEAKLGAMLGALRG
ncbi:MAG: isochorismate synthase [Sulfuricella sp.]|nr:isochorismate synthase [Sulfuricella sp.]